ncbi:SsrA-binding protein SmpB [Patescibacteria group bacterium]|nr:MAG: SsrA-binding protein SmpB [Patescibacteria group bacterium]
MANTKSSKKKPVKRPSAIVNKRATFDYAIASNEELVVGIALTGPETRAARDGHIQLKGSFVTVRNDELWLNNASFSLKINEKNKPGARSIDTAPRKLLAKRKQIDELYARKQTGMTIVPLRLLTKGKYIKVVIALGKGKKNYDKRETLKRRDQEREASRAMKNT